MKKEQFDITGMTCAACSSRVEGDVMKLPVLIVNGRYFKVGLRNLPKGSPNMDPLIAIISGAAAVYGIYAIYRISIGMEQGGMELVHTFILDLHFESAGMILPLITLGKILRIVLRPIDPLKIVHINFENAHSDTSSI